MPRSDSKAVKILAGPTFRRGASMLNRLQHCSVVFNFNGESYRMRSHRARTESLREGVSKVTG